MASGFVRKFFVCLTLTATMLLGLGAKKAVDIAKPVIEAATPDIDEADKNRFIQVNGKALTLPVGKEGINVLITNNFTDEQKQAVIEAINELDDNLLYVDYNIYLDASKAPNKCITIDEVDFTQYRTGLTMLTFVPGYPYLMYPIEISIDAERALNNKNEFMREQFKGTIKHELLHALGLADVYDETQNTIMYFSTHNNPNHLTQDDIDLVNKVYSKEYVNCPLFASTNIGEPVLVNTAKNKNQENEEEIIM